MEKEKRRIEVEVFVSSPLLYGLCPSCNDLLRMNRVDFQSQQLSEYPNHVREENTKIVDLLNKLITRFGEEIRISLTSVLTPGGFLKSIRRRVWKTPAFIIDRKKKMIGIPDEAELIGTIEKALIPEIIV
nr:hypothetical protein [Candidatus Njordarchaeota archaeon]